MITKRDVTAPMVEPTDKMGVTDDERVRRIRALPPEHFLQLLPIRGTAAERLVAGDS